MCFKDYKLFIQVDRMKKEIIYPFFLECCQFIDDIFWENIFEDLAYGKPPYGTYISKDFLCCNYKKKEFSYKIEKKQTSVIYNEVFELLSKRLGLLSPQDKLRKKKDFNDYENSIKDNIKTWSDIRKKNTKELLIELYITRMKNKYFLTSKQCEYLFSIIIIAIIFKVITSDDILFENGRINNIKGINFEKKKFIIERDLYNIDVNIGPPTISSKKNFYENWDKFLDNLRKTVIQ
jgi:hypothetical protein